ncbi:hypothetical protein SAMN06265338_101637 [Rhodoblastus acidophilus]|uniref:Uncharacterized protein n=1 Tax=Rhodoblastus acidophilus TaxID=1074 RepID=A0A212QJS8_RHOAC|nr:hypothetical protein [Rhodoblastus acidophilus]SNB59588.1 hypothetical protein SAMN06265338_101637 [Rhodoblastus acidophilus]
MGDTLLSRQRLRVAIRRGADCYGGGMFGMETV